MIQNNCHNPSKMKRKVIDNLNMQNNELVCKEKTGHEDLTMKSIKELRSGKVTRCKDYNDYLRKVKNI